MKKKLIYFFSAQIIIILVMLLTTKRIDLEAYTNVSFYIGGLVTFIGLVTYVVSGGFFDLYASGSRKFFTRKHLKDEIVNMRLPSEVFSFSPKPLLALGLSILACTCIALLFYYG
ncbi:DUF3899 domain-containing protein [Psychrobacillus sp. BL-248-WT-3]|uniref:DUF3899 domain-containing protein n=1 Tax=Psychrobacillus sp. BL-248-WT-3 TaxID=2725306 RepID=UPI00146C8DD1|nr:DUF3899 domain-containing protein [Psychrobacillus sp. BL-248-WT-3]NME07500.1 DUF3899 domain-containing protein [Psychrobacillus sp. BL-248-WT-3]